MKMCHMKEVGGDVLFNVLEINVMYSEFTKNGSLCVRKNGILPLRPHGR